MFEGTKNATNHTVCKWLILCHVNFISIERNNPIEKLSGPSLDHRALTHTAGCLGTAGVGEDPSSGEPASRKPWWVRPCPVGHGMQQASAGALSLSCSIGSDK